MARSRTKRLFFILLGAGVLALATWVSIMGKTKHLNDSSSRNAFPDTDTPPAVTWQEVWNHDSTWTATLEAQRTTTLLVTGDVLLARAVNHRMNRDNNWLWPWQKTASVLRSADITLINLEMPLTADCQPTLTGMIFCGSDRAVEGLITAGVDIASLANNHSMNQGEGGVSETESLLIEHGITPIGLRAQPVLTQHNNLTFAWLGYTDVGITGERVAPAQTELIRAQIQEAKQQADVVVVFFHWGSEYVSQPSTRQKELAHASIDAGADVVLGNHPHWVQSLELYQGKVIMYSHGNFIFDQMWSLETRQGVVGKYTFYDDQLVDVTFLPVQIEEYGQPYWLSGEARQKQLQHLEEISATLRQSYQVGRE